MMQKISTDFADAFILSPKVFGDDRGFFYESWREDEIYSLLCANVHFVQENHSKSAQNVLRGLHYQLPFPQGKLVRVVVGSVYDVIVDLRRSSTTLGHAQGFELSAQNKLQLWVPPGFAHGFYVTSPEAEFVYKCTDYYHPEAEHSLLWNDPKLNITWPLVSSSPTLSSKDAAGKTLDQAAYFD